MTLELSNETRTNYPGTEHRKSTFYFLRKRFGIQPIYHAAIVSRFPALPLFTSYVPDFKAACDTDFDTDLTNITGDWNQCDSECDPYHFDSSLWDETTTSEFRLVCNKDWYRDIPNYALYTGIGSHLDHLLAILKEF